MADTFLIVKNKETTPDKVQPVLAELISHAADKKQGLAQEEYLIWAVKSEIPKPFLNLLFQVSVKTFVINMK